MYVNVHYMYNHYTVDRANQFVTTNSVFNHTGDLNI